MSDQTAIVNGVKALIDEMKTELQCRNRGACYYTVAKALGVTCKQVDDIDDGYAPPELLDDKEFHRKLADQLLYRMNDHDQRFGELEELKDRVEGVENVAQKAVVS